MKIKRIGLETKCENLRANGRAKIKLITPLKALDMKWFTSFP